jgi:hypothetical protein
MKKIGCAVCGLFVLLIERKQSEWKSVIIEGEPEGAMKQKS